MGNTSAVSEKSERTETTSQPVENKIITYSHHHGRRNEISEICLDDMHHGWPVLDPISLYGIAGDFVELATIDSEADPAAVLVTFLTRFGIESGATPYFMVGESRHSPRIFSVVVGASSKARKGTSAKPVDNVFNLTEIIKEKARATPINFGPAQRSPGPLSTGEGIIYAVRDKVMDWKVNPKTGDGKWVKVDPGIDDKRLYVMDEEFASALSCTKREGNTLSAILRNLWDSGTIEPLTKSNRISTTNAHIGICTHITNDELMKKLDETEAFNGFANRFLFVCAKKSKNVPLPQPIDPGKLFIIQKNSFVPYRNANTLTE